MPGGSTLNAMIGSLDGIEQTRLRRCPAFGQQGCVYSKGIFIQVGEYLLYDRRIFDAGHHFDRTPAGTARCNVDTEHPPGPLC